MATPDQRLAEIMRREVKGQCLDCGATHPYWHKSTGPCSYGMCHTCYTNRCNLDGLPFKDAPPLLQRAP